MTDDLTPETARFGLAVSGRRVLDAEEQRDKAMSELKALVVRARHSGLSITEIAQLGGISRQTVYAELERASREKHAP